MKQIRVEVAGITVRLFAERRDAITAANGRTRLTEEQHDDYRVPNKGPRLGWVVKNRVANRYYDVDGEISLKTVLEIK
jgi:hypothetical protein